MPSRRGVNQGEVNRVVENLVDFLIRPIGGNLSANGVQWGPVATVGTTAVEVFNKLIDPGVDVALTELELGLNFQADNLNAASVGTLTYYWQARPNAWGTIGAYVNLTGTLVEQVATSGVATDPEEIVRSGFVDIGSLPEAPFDLSLMCWAPGADDFSCKVKNSTRVRLVGIVIPGN